jgi:hypothetical protein
MKPSNESNSDNKSEPSYFDKLLASCQSTGYKDPFGPGRPVSPLEQLHARIVKMAKEDQKRIQRYEATKQLSANNAKSIPENATIRKEYVKCGKKGCHRKHHGPYYFAYWKDLESNKLKKKYIGKYFDTDD